MGENINKFKYNNHFCRQNGIDYAGKHLIIDFWGAINIDKKDYIEKSIKEAIKLSNATLLNMYFHNFDVNGGISGVAVLSESHISVHTWPEYSYAAFDIFMCGQACAITAAKTLKKLFEPKRSHIKKIMRGVIRYESI